ncbi:MAG: glucuronyl hydrolase [Proteobacteria bacterium]|nr:glucuronyl hydrolase [Pseudomonadota bacterium]
MLSRMKRLIQLWITSFVTLGFTSLNAEQPALAQSPAIDVPRVMRVAGRKLSAFNLSHKDQLAYPTEAKGSVWTTVDSKNWVSGFYPGCLWYLYAYSKENSLPDAEKWRQMAEKWTIGLQNEQYHTSQHDIGFIIFDSYGNGFLLTGNTDYLPIINQSAASLSKRFVPTTGLIRSWGNIDDKTIQTTVIDNMMNLELLVWSSLHGGKAAQGMPSNLLGIAKSHADRVIEHFFREDGSVYHVVDLDPSSGKVIKKRTHQGKSDESTWSRGQAWAIYGFSSMYQYTQEPRYLKASERAADYYLSHLPPDFVPPSDFGSSLTGLEFKDSSAAAVAASALLRLSNQTEDPSRKKQYFAAAEKTLQSLTQAPYFLESDDRAGILNYAARNYCEDPESKLTNTSLIFGDYYLLEALLAYAKATESHLAPGS